MPDLLLELFSEEIPARMQKKAAGDLRKLVTDALVDAGLTYEGAKEYWTPRRLVLDLRGVSARSADIREERKGPRTDAPQKAIEGFMRGAGLSSVKDAQIQSDPKKGEFYVAVIEKPGQSAAQIIADIMPGIIRNFPWPKSMRWGEGSSQPGSLTWVRPLQSILCTFGAETEEPEIVEFEVGGLISSNKTYGHRFMAPDKITVKRFDDYAASLKGACVVIDAEQRKDMILADAGNLAFAQGFELVEDPRLLDEVCGLVEWPVVLMGEFDEEFLDIPPQVIQLTIRENQKCFVLKSNAISELVNRFAMVSNINASDGGKEVARGNGKVVNARLADAKFFWDADLAQIASDEGFAPWIRKLDTVTFHAKLGTQGDRVKRIMALAQELAGPIAASMNTPPTEPTGEARQRPRGGPAPAGLAVNEKELAVKAKRAAELCKADLNSAMVYEFPEVQGAMGRNYATRAGEDASVALAIEEHYKPMGPTDDVPGDPVSVAVALADKLDMLVGFWAIDEKPTGSKDPFALRRAALGVIRLVLENEVRLGLLMFFIKPFVAMNIHSQQTNFKKFMKNLEEINLPEYVASIGYSLEASWGELHKKIGIEGADNSYPIALNLLSFFHDRLKVHLRDKGIRHDLIDAIITPQSDDLLTISRRAEALQSLITSEEGSNLLAGYKRAANILAAEEKKGAEISSSIEPSLLTHEAEIALNAILTTIETQTKTALEKEDYASAMSAMATMRQPVDAFFDNVMVNDEDIAVRANRLSLLGRIRTVTAQVADFSKITG